MGARFSRLPGGRSEFHDVSQFSWFAGTSTSTVYNNIMFICITNVTVSHLSDVLLPLLLQEMCGTANCVTWPVV